MHSTALWIAPTWRMVACENRMIALPRLSPYTGDITAPSPNHDARRDPDIEGIVLHATADDGEEDLALSWLRSPKSQASCHLLVGRSGRVTRLVGDRQRAWHAGLSWWRGTSDVNSITLGIEIANRNDGERYTDAQYHRVAEIVAHYCTQGLSLDDVVSHEEIAEGRKTDPREWDWDLFRAMVQDQLWPPDIPEPDDSASVAAAPTAVVVSAAPAVAPAVVRAAVPVVAPPSVPVRQKPVPTAPKPKRIMHSRTVWLNACTALGAIGLLIGDALDLADRIGIHLSDEVTKWALFAVGVVNIILRIRTTRPLKCGPNGDCPSEIPKGSQTPPQVMMTDEQKWARPVPSDQGAPSSPPAKGLDAEPTARLSRTMRAWSGSGISRR